MASRFHLSTLGLAVWIASSASAPVTGCAEGEQIDPGAVSEGGVKHGTGGRGGSMPSLPAGGASGTSDPATGSGGSGNQGGSTGSGGTGNVADSSTPGSGGSAGQNGNAGSAGSGNMPMDAAIIPPDAPLAMGIVVFYKAGNTANMDDTIHFYLNIVNNGATDVPLSALKVRYYLIDELNGVGTKAVYDSNTSTYPGGQNYKSYTGVTKETVAMMTMVPGANSYLEITVNSSDQLAAKSALNLQCAYASPGGQPQNETNDYSANLAQTAFAQTTKIVVYQGTTVVAGMVPQ